MALQFSRTDSNTGHQFTVYARVDAATVILGAETIVTLNLYDSSNTAGQGLQPVLPPDVVTFMVDEMSGVNGAFVLALGTAAQQGKILSPVDALKTAVYTLLKGHAAYAGALDV